ncbi:MAG: thioredoxin domain-containing protein [Micromonosporaceae bacterium]
MSRRRDGRSGPSRGGNPRQTRGGGQRNPQKRPPRQPARVVREELARERRRRRTIWITTVSLAFLLLAGLTGWGIHSALKPKHIAMPKVASADGSGVVVGAGPVTVDVYLDFMCPHCKTFEEEAGPTLRNLIDDKHAKVVYHPVAFLDRASTNQYSTRSAASAGCAADQDKFLEYAQALFARQPSGGGPGLTDDELINVAGSVGILDPSFAQCVREGTYRPWVNRVNDRAAKRGVVGTPTVLVNGQQVDNSSQAIAAAVEAARPK